MIQKWSQIPLLAAITFLTSYAAKGEPMKPQPIILQNSAVTLQFDPLSGAWTGLIDRKTGANILVPDQNASMTPSMDTPRLNEAIITHAIANQQAIAMAPTWDFAPDTADGGEKAGFLNGDYGSGKWQSTPVPGQRGIGDDRLHNRAGVFWYRTEFTCPAEWSGKDLTLIIGAVDDYDETYVNGTKVGETGLDVPFHWETPRVYNIPASLIRQNQPNRLLVKCTNAAFDGGITSGPVVIGLESALKNPMNEPSTHLMEHSIQRTGSVVSLLMKAQTNGYEYDYVYTLDGARGLISRQLSIRNVSQDNRIINGMALVIPPIQVGKTQSVIFPGTLPTGDNAVKSIPEGQFLSPKSSDPLAVVWDKSTNLGLGTWCDSEQEFSPVSVQRKGLAFVIRHNQQIIAPLKPGQDAILGKQYFWVSHGSRDAALEGIQKVYRAIGLHAPAHHLPGLDRDILYCGHPGGTPEMSFIGYGGFPALNRYLPTLKKMGISLLWLLPIWDHGTDNRWNLYAPFDHYKISPLYGTPEELETLSKDARKDGIGLVFDLVPHGPPDFTPLAKEHPEWICRNEDGTDEYAWGQLAFDYAQPGWQDYMRGAAELDAKKFGAVGARVDCGTGSLPNWNPKTGYRPSFPTLGGGLEMNNAIRQGFLAVNHTAMLMPEEYSGANIFYRVSDLTYDAQLFFLMVDLQEKDASPELWARSLETFLHDQQLTLPPGALKMRWISNHDTVSWTFQKARPAKVYGVPKLRALWAMCAFVPGVPMLYQGDENPAVYGADGVNNVDYLAKIYGLRNHHDALSIGDANYTEVRASGGVFACVRKMKNEKGIVLISFNDQPVKTRLTAPASLAGEWVDSISGEKVHAANGKSITMAPYQVRVLFSAH
jgi:hypothetical protein